MKKKVYVKPAVEVVKLMAETALCAASPNAEIKVGDEEGDFIQWGEDQGEE